MLVIQVYSLYFFNIIGICDACLLNYFRVNIKFVVGEADCTIPPADRLSEYDCEEWMPELIGKH